MKRVLSVVLVLGSIIPVAALDKEKKFKVERAETYPNKATHEKITIAVVPFNDADEIKGAFGKADLLKNGVLPVLVIVDNGTGKAIRVNGKVEMIFADGQHIDAMPAADVPYIGGPKRRPDQPSSNPLPIPLPRKKNNMLTWEIEGRAFNTKLIPPGESVHGFFYFQTKYESGTKIYFTGLSDAATGKEFFYWEIPLKADK